MAVTYTRTLQNRSAQHPFMLTASMTRHYLGFHGATDLPNSGEEWVSAQWLADMHLPSYEAQMVEAQAEGIMCSCNTLRVGPGDGSAGGIPACVHPLLYDVLRNRWNSSALVQMDNEALYPMFQDHHYFPTLGAAIVGALDAGVVAIDSGQGAPILAELAALVEAGNVSEAQVDAFALRTFLLRFRLGEFDSHNPLNPYARAWDESLLDGPERKEQRGEDRTALVQDADHGHAGRNQVEGRVGAEHDARAREGVELVDGACSPRNRVCDEICIGRGGRECGGGARRRGHARGRECHGGVVGSGRRRRKCCDPRGADGSGSDRRRRGGRWRRHDEHENVERSHEREARNKHREAGRVQRRKAGHIGGELLRRIGVVNGRGAWLPR